MTRLIDGDALIELINGGYDLDFDEVPETKRELIRMITEQPIVDAVPVIRCYECKHFREFEKGFSNDWDGSCKYWNTHSTVYSNFCGCAERKEE